MNDDPSTPQNGAASAPPRKAVVLRKCLLLAICAGVFYLFITPGCSYPPGAVADGYASANVQTWNDSDEDGEKDAEESPLPWVTVQMAYELSITDSRGQGTVAVFKPGCAHKCWEGESVSVLVPPGYRATTPVEMDLTGEDRTYAFGFRREQGTQPLSFPNEPDWFQAFPNRGLDLTTFHYSVDDKRLAVSLDSTSSPDKNAFYRDVFDVIRTLKRIEGILVQEVEITAIPSDNVAVCELQQVEEFLDRVAPVEIVSTYCQHAESPGP